MRLWLFRAGLFLAAFFVDVFVDFASCGAPCLEDMNPRVLGAMAYLVSPYIFIIALSFFWGDFYALAGSAIAALGADVAMRALIYSNTATPVKLGFPLIPVYLSVFFIPAGLAAGWAFGRFARR